MILEACGASLLILLRSGSTVLYLIVQQVTLGSYQIKYTFSQAVHLR